MARKNRLRGVPIDPYLEVVSLHLDLIPDNDPGVAIADKHVVPIGGAI